MEKRPLWQQQLLQVIFVYLILLDQIKMQRYLFIIFFIGWDTNLDELISNGFFSMISMSSISIIKQYILHRHDCSVWSCHPQLLFTSLTYFLPLQLTFLSVLGKTGLSNSRWLDWGPITFHFLVELFAKHTSLFPSHMHNKLLLNLSILLLVGQSLAVDVQNNCRPSLGSLFLCWIKWAKLFIVFSLPLLNEINKAFCNTLFFFTKRISMAFKVLSFSLVNRISMASIVLSCFLADGISMSFLVPPLYLSDRISFAFVVLTFSLVDVISIAFGALFFSLWNGKKAWLL